LKRLAFTYGIVIVVADNEQAQKKDIEDCNGQIAKLSEKGDLHAAVDGVESTYKYDTDNSSR
jgi:hypothetical protein